MNPISLHRSLAGFFFCCALAGNVQAQKKADPGLPEKPVVGQSQPIKIRPRLREVVQRGGGLFWSKLVRGDQASFVKAHFANVNLRRGDVLVLRSMTGKEVERITSRGPKDRGSFWALSAFGDGLFLEFSFSKPYDYVPFRIDRIIFGDPDMFGPPEPTESICSPADFEDVICYSGDAGKWSNVLASVGVMSVGGNPNTALFCSGSNVSPQNYVLTNDHCITSQAECDSSEFVFKFYRTNCNMGGAPNGDWVSYRCDDIVASSPFVSCDQGLADLDFALCSVIGDPASTFGFATPDPDPLTDGEGIYIVQHPAGRPHEIAHGSGANVDVDGTVLRYYDTLDTEGGSSGSPIYRESDDKLIGLHHCGGCSTPGTGNRGMLMSDIYPHIESFLCTPAVDVTSAGFEALAQVDGNGDGILDPGETWEFRPKVRNNACSTLATGVTGDVAVNAGSAAVTVIQPVADFGDIAAGAVATSTVTVSFLIEGAVGCGDTIALDLTNLTATNGGPFADELAILSEQTGDEQVATEFFDDYSGGFANWAITDGGAGGGTAATWSTANPGARSLSMTAPFSIVDSDEAGTGATQDEAMASGPVDCTCFETVRLQFTHDFNHYSGGLNEQADVQVRSTATGGAWTTVANYSGGDASGTVVLDITPEAAGQSDLEVRFHYYDGQFEWWWAIDDVFVLGSKGFLCAEPPGGPGGGGFGHWKATPVQLDPCD